MSAQQFTIYSSSDGGNGSDQPGLLVGSSNDLIRVLDKILVNGYTGKTAAGWTKPFANSGNLGCYKNGTGSGMTLFVNDNGPNATPSTREAWIVGWESLSALSGTMGTGIGQFPTTAQGSSGRLVVRKSADLTTGRPWICFADAYTFYFFVVTGDFTGNVYCGFGFGDIYSLAGATADPYRCMIYGRSAENSNLANTGGDWDVHSNMNTTASNVTGLYMARTTGGGGQSVQVARCGDQGFSGTAPSSSASAMDGKCPTPNASDGCLHIAALRCFEWTFFNIRGRFRGVYHVLHPIAAFTDGQRFAGGGDFAGKTFQIIARGPSTGYWAIEVSASVETN